MWSKHLPKVISWGRGCKPNVPVGREHQQGTSHLLPHAQFPLSSGVSENPRPNLPPPKGTPQHLTDCKKL